MTDKLYGIDYLKQTTQLLAEIKQQSYTRFLDVTKGTIVDLGCGTGQDALHLAKLLPQDVIVVGADNNPEMIAAAKSLKSEQQITNVDFVLADANSLPFETASLSGIRNERLIQHLQYPDKVFREFHRTLQPGAPLVIVETDWSSFTLYNAPPGVAEKVRNFYINPCVPNGSAAIRLSASLREGGFRDIALHVFPLVSHSLMQVIAFVRLDFVLQQMELSGLITAAELQALNESMEYADKNGHFATSLNLVIATANR